MRAGDALLDAREEAGVSGGRSSTSTGIRLVRTTDGAAWDALVAAAEGGTVFHTWSWLDLQSRLQQAAIDRLLVLDGDRPIGVFPMPRRGRPAIDSMPASFPYLGPLVPAEQLVATLRALRAWQLRHGMLLVRFEFAPDAAPEVAAALEQAGCPVWEDATVVVDLRHRSTEAMRAAYAPSRRKDMRRAVRDGSSVRPALPGEPAELLPRVLAEAFDAHGGQSPYPDEIGSIVEEWAEGRPDVGLFTALVGDEPAGSQIVVGAGRTAMAWVGASLRRFRNENPNVLLYDALLGWALERGYAEVDLCGLVDDGVRRYKLAFGGAVRPYLRSESFLGPRRLRPASGEVGPARSDQPEGSVSSSR